MYVVFTVQCSAVQYSVATSKANTNSNEEITLIEQIQLMLAYFLTSAYYRIGNNSKQYEQLT